MVAEACPAASAVSFAEAEVNASEGDPFRSNVELKRSHLLRLDRLRRCYWAGAIIAAR
jgi:hypothetical protein